MNRFRLQLLGGFRLATADGEFIPIPHRKATALVAYLGATVGSFSARDRLASLLWGQSEQRLARQSLRQTLQTLGQGLAGAGGQLLHLDRQLVGLDAARVDVDAAEFETLVSQGSPGSLAKASSLYQGEFLAGLSVEAPDFEEWLALARSKYQDLALHGLTKLVEHHHAAGDYEAACESAKRALRIDPFREDVHRSLMRMYAARGMRATALAQYRDCEETLRRELGVAPDEDTSRLHNSILAQSVTDKPAIQMPRTRANVADTAFSGTRLIGFDLEVGSLRHSVATAEETGARVVAIIGEAGAGKSALLVKVQNDALNQGAILATARARPAEQKMNFAFWIDLLDSPALEIVNDDDLKSSLFRRLAFLRGTNISWNRPNRAAEADNRAVFDAVVDLIRARSQGATLVLAIEDLQHADPASLRLLSYAVRSLRQSPVSVIVTLRPNDSVTRQEVVETLADLDRDGLLQRLALKPLSRVQVETLANATSRDRGLAPLTRPRLREIWTMSDGIPGIVVESVRGHAEDGTETEPPALPESLHADWHRRTASLDDDARQLAAATSVIGHGLDYGMLAQVTGLGEEATLRGVEALIAAGFLTMVGDQLAFARARLQLAQYRSMLPARRRQLHFAVATAIANSEISNPVAHYAALVHHFTAAGRPADALVSELRLGQSHRRRGAYAVARRTLQHVSRSAQAMAPSAHISDCEIEAQIEIAEIEETTGQFCAALVILRRLASNVRVSQVAHLSVRLLCTRGRVNWVLGNDRTGLDYTRNAVKAAHGQEEVLWQLSDRILEMIGIIFGRAGPTFEVMDKMRNRANRGGLTQDESAAGTVLALLHAAWGNFDAAFAEAQRAIDKAGQVRDARYLAVGMQVRGIVRTWCGDPKAALTDFDDAIELANSCGDVLRLYQVHCHKGHALIRAGRWSRAVSELDMALALAERVDIRFGRPLCHAWKAWALVELGECAMARIEARAALKLATATNRPWAHSVAVRSLAAVLAHPSIADLVGAERAMRIALEEQYEMGLEFERASSLVLYAKILRSAGETQRSKSLVSQAQVLFARLKMALSREAIRDMTEITCAPCGVSR